MGKFGDNKGKNEWIKVANVVKSEKLEYELFYFGTSDIKIDGVTNVYVQVKPDNPKAMYEALVDNGINCAFCGRFAQRRIRILIMRLIRQTV